jgi:hypothetical protein
MSRYAVFCTRTPNMSTPPTAKLRSGIRIVFVSHPKFATRQTSYMLGGPDGRTRLFGAVAELLRLVAAARLPRIVDITCPALATRRLPSAPHMTVADLEGEPVMLWKHHAAHHRDL